MRLLLFTSMLLLSKMSFRLPSISYDSPHFSPKQNCLEVKTKQPPAGKRASFFPHHQIGKSLERWQPTQSFFTASEGA